MSENLFLGRQGNPVHVENNLLIFDVQQSAEDVTGLPRLLKVALGRGEVPHQLTASVVRATELVIADTEPILCDVIIDILFLP